MLSSDSVDNVLTQVIQEKFAAIEPLLNERTRRRWAAVEARALGRGGIARVAEATGLSRATISAGLQELAAGPEDDDAAGRLRGTGAGRKALAEHDAGLVAALERLVDPATRGDPTGPLRWTCSSAARLSRELRAHPSRRRSRPVYCNVVSPSARYPTLRCLERVAFSSRIRARISSRTSSGHRNEYGFLLAPPSAVSMS